MKNSGTDNKYIFIVLSQTPTKFGIIIRRIIKEQYNHASIAFDERLDELYSFGRYQHKVPLVAGLIKEYPERFSLLKKAYINVRIFKIPVSQAQFIKGKCRVRQIDRDKDGYLYNLFSVISYPFFGGFSTFKAYSCVEFVAHILHFMNVPLCDDKADCRYTPEEIGSSLDLYLEYEGNLLDYCNRKTDEFEHFFESPNYIMATGKSVKSVARLLYRMVRYKVSSNQ